MAVRVCLSMIVRNEARVIARCLDAARPVIDAVAICDTGSTDDTVAVVEHWIERAGLPGRVLQQPFLDFGRSRTRALRSAKRIIRELGWKLPDTYLLFLDADMVLQIGAAFCRDALTADVYLVNQRMGSLEYPNVRLMRASVDGRFTGSTHEYFSSPEGTDRQFLPTLRIDDRHDGGHRAHKFQRDRRLLERELKRDPGNTRAMFYLAETYRGLRDLPKALALYRRRSEAGGWEEEAWYAQYAVGQLQWEGGRPRQAFRAFAAAIRRDPKRHEPYVMTAGLLRNQRHYSWACRFARRALAMGMPRDRHLFLDRELYEWSAPCELAASGFFAGAREEGFEANERTALGRGAPAHVVARAVYNAVFFAAPLPGEWSRPLRPRLDPVFTPCNPGLVRTDRGYLVVCRAVSYRIRPDGGYAVRSDDGVFRSQNVLMEFDADLTLRAETPVHESLAPVRSHVVQGLEDPRPFIHQGRAHFLCTTTNLHPAGVVRMSLCRVGHDGAVDHHRPLTGHGDDRPQKNWLPFVAGGEVFAIYSYQPLVVLKVDPETGRVAVVVERDQGRPFGDWRGSGGPVDLPPRSGGGRLVLIHEVSAHRTRVYMHRFVRIDNEWRITQVSRPFYFRRIGIEFASGMCPTHEGDAVLISFGVHDCEAWLCKVPLDDVCRRLMDLPDWPLRES